MRLRRKAERPEILDERWIRKGTRLEHDAPQRETVSTQNFTCFQYRPVLRRESIRRFPERNT